MFLLGYSFGRFYLNLENGNFIVANKVQQKFALCVALGLGNWQAANMVGYRNKHCARLRRSQGVEEELGRIRSEMIDKTHFTKEFMLEKLFRLMGQLEGARLAGEEALTSKEQREHIKMALEVGKEINKMLGHYSPVNSQHLRLESSSSELTALIERVEQRCRDNLSAESEIAEARVVREDE